MEHEEQYLEAMTEEAAVLAEEFLASCAEYPIPVAYIAISMALAALEMGTTASAKDRPEIFKLISKTMDDVCCMQDQEAMH